MVLLELSVVPVGKGESLSREVAACVDLIDKSGLPYELHAMGTIIEGELDEVMSLMQQCIELLANKHDRVTCSARLDYRQGATGQIRQKVTSVEQKLGHATGRAMEWELDKPQSQAPIAQSQAPIAQSQAPIE